MECFFVFLFSFLVDVTFCGDRHIDSHTSKVMLKILQAKFQKYVN